jgi:NAD(P)H-nitrite reductase large subunit
MNKKEQEIIDGLKTICQCKGIRKSVFLKHIKAGLKTAGELKKATGAGTGSCKGKKCTPRIAEMLKSNKPEKHLTTDEHG